MRSEVIGVAWIIFIVYIIGVCFNWLFQLYSHELLTADRGKFSDNDYRKRFKRFLLINKKKFSRDIYIGTCLAINIFILYKLSEGTITKIAENKFISEYLFMVLLITSVQGLIFYFTYIKNRKISFSVGGLSLEVEADKEKEEEAQTLEANRLLISQLKKKSLSHAMVISDLPNMLNNYRRKTNNNIDIIEFLNISMDRYIEDQGVDSEKNLSIRFYVNGDESFTEVMQRLFKLNSLDISSAALKVEEKFSANRGKGLLRTYKYRLTSDTEFIICVYHEDDYDFALDKPYIWAIATSIAYMLGI